jgi:hypothetical protein
MKKKLKKVTLNRETLRLLENVNLMQAEGGATQMRTECGSCPASACHPTFCPFTTCSNDC